MGANSKNKEAATSEPKDEKAGAAVPVFRSRQERLLAGKALRQSVPHESHAHWKPPAKRRDPVEILQESDGDRLPQLVPIRYGRMSRSPFPFLRGSAGLMAYDLATTPSTGIQVQACGDCHLLNFGLFATPERNLAFDINDFDESAPAPWEWDVKRLAVSFVVAGHANQFTDKQGRAAAAECVRAYREHLRTYSKMSPLEVWYDRLTAEAIIAMAPDAVTKKRRQRLVEKAQQRTADYLYPQIVAPVGGTPRLVDQPPILFHSDDKDAAEAVQEAMESYRLTLSDERRVLYDRYRMVDIAYKVVGIGSVGTRCAVALFFSEDGHPLLLQVKEAGPSVLEPYAGKSVYENSGQRIVMAQRLTQSSSDIFLGWTRGRAGRNFYVRQLRDMKMSVPTEGVTPKQLMLYAELCGWTLARAHAKSGDAASISGYLGKSDSFDEAIGDFALAYARQNARDHRALVTAVKEGRVNALVEEDL